jgi:hypothetical protein
MIFLNPAILLGLLAASIPVLIHLLNLRKLKKIEFSTLTFLKELQKNKIRKIKLKQWLLLALRVAIILLLVMAFARPTLEGIAIGGTTSAAKTTAVFILDDTFSMSAVDENGSYLNQAKETIKKLMDELQEGDEAALVRISDLSNELPKPTGNLVELRNMVEQTDISYASGTIHSAIIKAARIMEESQNFNKEIYLLSDFQSSRHSDENSFSDLSDLLNEKIKLYGFNFSGKNLLNNSVDSIKVNTQIFEKNKPINFAVSVTNHSDRPVDNTVVSLFIDGERSGQQSISLSGGESQIVSMDALVKASGFIDVFAEIEDDDILHDNRRYTNLFIPDELPVIIFSGIESDAAFVETALSAAENERPIRITKRNLNQIASFDLNKFSVVFIIGSGANTATDRLINYVQNGGGLFLMPGSKTGLQDFQAVTGKLNIPSPSGEAGELGKSDNAVSFESIQFEHSIFQNIFEKNDKRNVESPEIYYRFKINSGAQGREIISLLDGSAFLSEYKLGSGKIFLLNTAPVLSWSNFPLKSIFVPLMNKSAFYLASKERASIEYIAGSSIDVNLSGLSLPQIKILTPDNNEEFINLDEGNNFLSYNRTDAAGNYKIYSGDNLINSLSVNANPLESVSNYLTQSEFEDYLNEINFKGYYLNISTDEDPAAVILQSRFGSELWKYFLLAALLLALIEMAVARSTKKDLVGV